MGKRAMGLGALAGVLAAAIGTLLLAPSGDSALASQRDSVPRPPLSMAEQKGTTSAV